MGLSAIASSSALSCGASFSACLQRSLEALRDTLSRIETTDGGILTGAEAAIRAVQHFSVEHANYTRMYLRLTAESGGEYAKTLARAIEELSAEVYTRRIARAKDAGDVRGDMDPRLFAFFFDSLLMMMQFSYCCDYYQERFRLYCGEAAQDSALVAGELLKFLESAFTTQRGISPTGQLTLRGNAHDLCSGL